MERTLEKLELGLGLQLGLTCRHRRVFGPVENSCRTRAVAVWWCEGATRNGGEGRWLTLRIVSLILGLCVVGNQMIYLVVTLLAT